MDQLKSKVEIAETKAESKSNECQNLKIMLDDASAEREELVEMVNAAKKIEIKLKNEIEANRQNEYKSAAENNRKYVNLILSSFVMK
jgi:hypothetical protein